MQPIAHPLSIVVMGVSGCGKSTVGKALAGKLGGHFADGDDFHPAENVAKMSRGVALNDEDRMPWLGIINEHLKAQPISPGVKVVACSALKRQYRETLSRSTDVLFVHLAGSFELIQTRSEARQNHFMDVALLQSQFDTLELPDDDERVVTVDISANIQTVINDTVAKVQRHPLYLAQLSAY